MTSRTAPTLSLPRRRESIFGKRWIPAFAGMTRCLQVTRLFAPDQPDCG